MFQIYQIISGTVKTVEPKLECPEFKPVILKSNDTYPYLLNYQADEYLKYQQQISELMGYQSRPALPAALVRPGSSVAGGSRHTKRHHNRNHNRNHKLNHKNTRKHSSKLAKTTQRRLHNRINNRKHNTSQKR